MTPKRRAFVTATAAALSWASLPGWTKDEELPKLKPGDTPPDELGHTREGDAVKVSQFAGKVLVVTFWASWCGPCLNELNMLERLQRAAKDRLNVVAVNIEERDTFRRIYRALKDNISFTLANDPSGRYKLAYGVKGIPHMVIVGKDGKVINVHRGYGDSALDGLLVEINQALQKA